MPLRPGLIHAALVVSALLSASAQADLETFCRGPLDAFNAPVYFEAVFGDTPRCEYHPNLDNPLASVTKIFTGAAAYALLDRDRPFNHRLEWQEIKSHEHDEITHLELIGDGGTFTWAWSERNRAYFPVPWGPEQFKGFATQLVARGVRKILGPIRARASDPRWNHTPLPHWIAEDSRKDCDFDYPRAFMLSPEISCPTLIVAGGKNASWSNRRIKNPIQFVSTNGPGLAVDWGEFPSDPSTLTPIRVWGHGQRRVLIPDSEYLATELLREAIEAEPRLMLIETLDSRAYGEKVIEPIAGAPLPVTLSHFLKESVNVVGETLLRAVGIRTQPDGDALSAGLKAIDNYIHRKDSTVRYGDVNIADGCGLSHETWATPEGMVAFLKDLEGDAAFISEFREFLAVPGTEGTLKGRLLNLSDWIRAKTGTMRLNGVHTLAGYARQDNHWVPFAIFSQTVKMPPEQAESFHRQIVSEIDQVVNSFVRELDRPLLRPLR